MRKALGAPLAVAVPVLVVAFAVGVFLHGSVGGAPVWLNGSVGEPTVCKTVEFSAD